MVQKIKRRLHNINRFIVIFLTIASVAADGLQTNDYIGIVTVVFWLFLDELRNAEIKGLSLLTKSIKIKMSRIERRRKK